MVIKDAIYQLEFSTWCQVNTNANVFLSISLFFLLSFLEYGVPTYNSPFSLSQYSELYCMYQTFQTWKTKVFSHITQLQESVTLIRHVNPCNFTHLSYEKVKRSQDTTKSYPKRAELKMQRKKNKAMPLKCCLQHSLLFGSAVCSGPASEEHILYSSYERGSQFLAGRRHNDLCWVSCGISEKCLQAQLMPWGQTLPPGQYSPLQPAKNLTAGEWSFCLIDRHSGRAGQRRAGPK